MSEMDLYRSKTEDVLLDDLNVVIGMLVGAYLYRLFSEKGVTEPILALAAMGIAFIITDYLFVIWSLTNRE
jgi:hypothetical protein